ncbi:MAG TPA: hypothetical protein EYG90_02905 [Campylobacterales bacterium]|nr:hypothetical protein [Campylobacterales bacterium]
MKEILNIYKANRIVIENYINTMISNIEDDSIKSYQKILKKYNFIQLMYEVNNKYRQISPVVCRKESVAEGIDSDKSHYFIKLKLNENGIYISNPYIHYRTGKSSISVVAKFNDKYKVFDIDLVSILEHLKLIEYNSVHEKYKKAIYTMGSLFLSIVSIMLIAYGGYIFVKIIFSFGDIDFLQTIFKSIISITLGLAIFDLAKQIFEHEVLFDSFHHPEDKEYKVLGKFLISIVIALAIETLMVVFKVALDDYTQMLSAFYLMIGTTLMFVGLAYFYKIIIAKK